MDKAIIDYLSPLWSDSFFIESTLYEDPYRKPEGVCPALLHVLDLYAWRTALGFPSWGPMDRKAHM
ncbi:MAG: hypothetical protein V1710_02845, partial [Candidatus Bathyarchaeota archaeon]